MLKGLSGVLEKSKNLKLPLIDKKDKKEPSQPTATESKPVAAPPQPVAPPPPAAPSTKKKTTRRKKSSAVGAVPVVPIQIIDGQVQVRILPEDKAKTLPAKYRDAFAGNAAAEFTKDSISQENADLVIAAAYKQVFGNAHLMDTERSATAESQVRSGEISVLEFIRALAKSDRYRALFWEPHPNVTAIELNFKHLLGRAPESYDEVSDHIKIIAEGGFEAEIDAYLDSDEYFQNFGDMYVPYPRGYDTQTGRNSVGYSRAFSLFGFACASDKSRFGSPSNGLKPNLLENTPGDIPEIRSIPESYSEELVQAVPPRFPVEFRAMARQLLTNVDSRRAYRPS